MIYEFKNGEIKYNSDYGYYIGNYNNLITYTLKDINDYDLFKKELEIESKNMSISGTLGITLKISNKKDYILVEVISNGVLNYTVELHK